MDKNLIKLELTSLEKQKLSDAMYDWLHYCVLPDCQRFRDRGHEIIADHYEENSRNLCTKIFDALNDTGRQGKAQEEE